MCVGMLGNVKVTSKRSMFPASTKIPLKSFFSLGDSYAFLAQAKTIIKDYILLHTQAVLVLFIDKL